jgi:hypothetical protein
VKVLRISILLTLSAQMISLVRLGPPPQNQAGYKSFDKFEIGPASTFYSWNPVERIRHRFGGRTTSKLSRCYYLEAYADYGFIDEKWKGFGSFTYSLNNNGTH